MNARYEGFCQLVAWRRRASTRVVVFRIDSVAGAHLQWVRQPARCTAAGRRATRNGWIHHRSLHHANPLRTALRCLAAVAAVVSFAAVAQTPITLHGASQFGDDHPFTKGLVKFEELVKKYYGKPINFVLHKNSELGLEKDYFAYMNQGISVDYAIVSPAHMATFAKAAPFIDAPFVFGDHEQMNKVIEQDVLKPIADEIAQKADVLLIGFGGGGVRNIFATKPIHNMAELKGLKIRVQGAPIWTRTFSAAGMAPTVIAYSEIYNGIQTGVIQSGENEAAGVEQMKFYEVGPNLMLTQHAISIRPICFSGKTLARPHPVTGRISL